MVELRQLHYFLAVAERLSITRAAEDLRMAQPALSQAVSKLERHLGVPLFDRSHRRLRLTAAGTTLVPEARALLGRARLLRGKIRPDDVDRVPLRIGCIASAISGLLPAVLPVLLAHRPATEPTVLEMGQQAQVAALRAGDIDVGVCRVLGTIDDVEVRRLPDEPLYALLPADHPVAARPQVALADLATEDLVCFPRDLAPVAFDTIVAACVRAGFSPRITQEASNDQSILGIVASGLAVAVVPRATTRLRTDGVVALPVTDSGATTPLSVVVSATAPSTVGVASRDALLAVVRA